MNISADDFRGMGWLLAYPVMTSAAVSLAAYRVGYVLAERTTSPETAGMGAATIALTISLTALAHAGIGAVERITVARANARAALVKGLEAIAHKDEPPAGFMRLYQETQAEPYLLKTEDGREGVYVTFEGVPEYKLLQLAASVVQGDTSLGINHRTEGSGKIFTTSQVKAVRKELVDRGLAIEQDGQVILNSAGKRFLRDRWARANSPTSGMLSRKTAQNMT